MNSPFVPVRQVRAVFDHRNIVVYQAYSSSIADPALAAGRFVPPFKVSRMTWIKPSFLWMMYRCGWASKPGQERVLAITITREGFEWALASSCLSYFDPAFYQTEQAWLGRKVASTVRVQWDPERSLKMAPLPYRAIQIGLGSEAVHRYVNDWTVRIDDVTPLARDIAHLVAANRLTDANDALPSEQAYPLSAVLCNTIGIATG
jgi:hypothetical protein